MTEETPWIGGQFTSQTVPPDEHRFIESFGSSDSYRELRRRIRNYYLENFPVTAEARANRYFNPGNHECSSLACEPRAALAAFTELLAPYVHSGRLIIHTGYRPVTAEMSGDRICSVRVESTFAGDSLDLVGSYVLDASELGDLLPLAGAEHVTGAEAQELTNEPHAYPGGNERCQMAITWCFAIDYVDGDDHTIDRPEQYEFFRDHIPPHWHNPQLSFVALDYDTMGPWQHTFLPVVHGGPLWQSLWLHRRMIDKSNFAPVPTRATSCTSTGHRMITSRARSSASRTRNAPAPRRRAPTQPLVPLLAADRSAEDRRRPGLPGCVSAPTSSGPGRPRDAPVRSRIAPDPSRVHHARAAPQRRNTRRRRRTLRRCGRGRLLLSRHAPADGVRTALPDAGLAVPDPARLADSPAHSQPDPGLQEPRRHAVSSTPQPASTRSNG